MIVLTDTDELQMVLAGSVTTNQLQCFSSWRDRTSTTFTADNTPVNSNNNTDVALVPAPAAGVQRIVDLVNIYNRDTVAQTVTVKVDLSGTEYILIQTVLNAGETLTYVEGAGWSVTERGSGFVIPVQALTSSPTDAQTVYFGSLPKAPVTAADTSKVYIPKSSRIKRAEIYCYSGTAGTAENWSLYVRINNTTDHLIATVGQAQSERKFQNASLDIPVVAGDYFEIKGVQPTWATNPLTTIYGGYVYFE